MADGLSLEQWLREQCNEFRLDVRGVFRKEGVDSTWPVTAETPEELEQRLTAGGHLLPLPQEPAALANVLEVSIVDFLVARLGRIEGASVRRGTERGYPDLEVSGEAFGGGYHAVDVKAARRSASGAKTNNRITLYTGNTYFKWPNLHWPGTLRPFDDYASHLDLVLVYTFNKESTARVENLEVIVHEAWRIASRQRSSTTREYIGAVENLDDLRAGRGEFATPVEFYQYWRAYPFRISPLGAEATRVSGGRTAVRAGPTASAPQRGGFRGVSVNTRFRRRHLARLLA